MIRRHVQICGRLIQATPKDWQITLNTRFTNHPMLITHRKTGTVIWIGGEKRTLEVHGFGFPSCGEKEKDYLWPIIKKQYKRMKKDEKEAAKNF